MTSIKDSSLNAIATPSSEVKRLFYSNPKTPEGFANVLLDISASLYSTSNDNLSYRSPRTFVLTSAFLKSKNGPGSFRQPLRSTELSRTSGENLDFNVITSPVSVIMSSKLGVISNRDRPFNIVNYNTSDPGYSADTTFFIAANPLLPIFVRGLSYRLEKDYRFPGFTYPANPNDGYRPSPVVLGPEPYSFVDFGGISITTLKDGNDLIQPNGTGFSYLGYGYSTLVDRRETFVNVGNGSDVVTGGYGQDNFGSRSAEKLVPLRDINNVAKSVSSGSKFFLGGSNDDLLDASSGADLLVGDRWDGNELYVPKNLLTNIPDTWSDQAKSLAGIKLQEILNYPAGSDLTARWYQNHFKDFPLWIPGNDTIRGYEGDDIIYGDDNDIDSHLDRLVSLRQNLVNTPQELLASNFGYQVGFIGPNNWNNIKLGADFIDGGTGNDQIYSGVGADQIIGGAGSDIIDTGPQIIVPGYDPFFGPKILYGGVKDPITGSSPNDPLSKAPNIFLIGELFSNEAQLKASSSGSLPQLLEEDKLKLALSAELSDLEKGWSVASNIVGLIPGIGKIIQAVGDTVQSIFNITQPKYDPIATTPPTALDAMNIIQDFGPDDQIAIRLPKGSALRPTRGSIYISGVEQYCLGKGTGTKGVQLDFSSEAGGSFARVFLPNVTQLVTLSEQYDPASGLKTVLLGGSNFASATVDGKQLFSPVF